MNLSKLALVAAIAAVAVTGTASAALITSPAGLTDGVDITTPASNLFRPGPIAFGPGITWTSGNGSSVFGYTGEYGFSANGAWDGGLGPMEGTNDGTSTMTFAFATAVSGFGGFINYAPG